jgi:magnesium chelatase family protein
LVIAYNPCPCGYLGDLKHNCSCTPTQVQRYENRLSGPLLDRIDMHLEAASVPYKEMSAVGNGESSSVIKKRVEKARLVQKTRFKHYRGYYCNGQMTPKDIKKICSVDRPSEKLLENAVERLGLSARSYHRIFKIARTIADLDQCERLQVNHIAEAIQYRRLDTRK